MTKIKDYIRGDTRPISIACKDSVGATLDLTGATLKFTLSTSQTPAVSDTPALQKTDTTHLALVSGTTPSGVSYSIGDNTAAYGIGWFKILPADTNSLDTGTYYYDVEVTDASGNVSSLKQDEFIINADITRS